MLLVLFATGCHSLPRCHEAVQEKTPRATVKALESQHVIEVNANGLLYDLRPGQGHRLITDATGVTLAVTRSSVPPPGFVSASAMMDG